MCQTYLEFQAKTSLEFQVILERRKTSYVYYKESLYSRLTRWRRRKLWQLSEAQNHHCAYCGKKTHFNKHDLDRATLEHLIPVSKSSRQTNKDENLVMACSHCNGIRSNMDPMKFYNKIRCEPWSPITERKEAKLSKDPEKKVKQQEKQGRLLEWCWIIVYLWPEDAQATIDHKPKCLTRKKYDQHINEIRQRIRQQEVIQ